MKEYIEREELYEAMNSQNCEFSLIDVLALIEEFPAADVVEVVRCRECKHARDSKNAFDWDGKTPLCECDYMTLPHRRYEYCSWGEWIETVLPKSDAKDESLEAAHN